MVQAIASNPGAANTAGSAGSANAALQAQLERYQKELSDCVNCASAKTPEGKTQIDDISSKISELKSRIEKVGDARPSDTLDQSASASARLKDGSVNSAAANTNAAAAAATTDQNTANGGARPGSASLTVGGLLDLYS
ncbi:MAG: FlxA-like family protein [Pseudomonadota bacterium]